MSLRPAAGANTSGATTDTSYIRGVNATTFLSYANFGQYAGNESAASYQYLKSKGVDIVRIPISWERIQPTLGGPLATAEVARLNTELSRANAAGIQTIIDLHNFARFTTSTGTVLVFSRGITSAQFADTWTKLATQFQSTPGLAAYDLMNEPHNLINDDQDDTRADAVIWEQFSQAAVNAIRATGDWHVLLIEGMHSSGVEYFAQLHPSAWIDDPIQGNSVYSAHHYFDYTGEYITEENGAPDMRYSTWAQIYADGPGQTSGLTFDQYNLGRLDSYTSWLSSNGVEGTIGEVGWPAKENMISWGLSASVAQAESDSWNALAEAWYEKADAASMSITYYSASGAQADQYAGAPSQNLPERDTVFVHGAGNGSLVDSSGNYILGSNGEVLPQDMDTAYSQYSVLANHPSQG